MALSSKGTAHNLGKLEFQYFSINSTKIYHGLNLISLAQSIIIISLICLNIQLRNGQGCNFEKHPIKVCDTPGINYSKECFNA